MVSHSFQPSEANVLSKINEGYTTFDELKSQVGFSEKTLNQVLESLISKHILEYNKSTQTYGYTVPVNGEKIILGGNLLLPCTVLRYPTYTLVGRGLWYKFPADFDINRIIWNVKLPDTKNTSLVQLITESVMKEKKARIVQLPEYKNLVNKLVPYSENVMFKINVVGEEVTDVSIMFKKQLSVATESIRVEFRGMFVRSEIKTDELINELRKAVGERNFKNIHVNRIYSLSDFIFSNNEIPYAFNPQTRTLSYAKITGIRGCIEITYYDMDVNGDIEKTNVEKFEDSNAGIGKLRELFEKYARKIVEAEDFMVE